MSATPEAIVSGAQPVGLRSARLVVPLCVLGALALVRPLDTHLYDFLGHMLLATAAMLLLAVAGSSYARGSDGYFRYLGYALPWFAILQFAEAFVHARHGHGTAFSGQFLVAAHVLQAAILVAAGLHAGRRATVRAATLPWALCSLVALALMLNGFVLPHAAFEGVALALLAAAAVVVHRRREAFDPGTLRMVRAALALTLAAQALSLALGAGHHAGGRAMEELVAYVPRLLGLWLLYVAGLRSMLATPGREAVYERMFQDSAIGLSLTRMDGSFLTVNAAFAAIYGYESPEALIAGAKSVASLYAFPEERKRVLETVRHDGVANGFELRMRRRDGALRWMRVTLVPVRNRAGEMIGLHAAVRDITEGREAGEKAATDSARLKKLVEVLPMGVWLVDEAGRLVLGNEASQRIWGTSRFTAVDDLTSFKRWWLATGKPVGKEDSPLYGAIRRGETRLGDEFEIEAFDGARRIVRASAAPIEDDAGRIIGAFVLNEDITAAKRQEEELRRFAELVRSSSDAIVQMDLKGRIVSWNEGAREIFGYAQDEILGRPVSDLVPAELRESQAPLLRRALEGEHVEHFETTRRRKDGTLIRISLGISPVHDSAGRIVGAAGISRDITERERAAEQLRRQERYFRSLIETSSDIITVTDADWRYTYVSPALERVLGYRAEEILGRRFLELTPEEDVPVVRDTLALLGTQPGASVLLRGRTRRKDGTLRTMEITVVRGVGEQGEPIHVLTGRDVTEREAAERELRSREHELRTLVDNSPIIISRWDGGLRCLFVNAAVSTITGRPPAAYIGKTWPEMDVPADFAKAFEGLLRQVFETRREQVQEMRYAVDTREHYLEVRLVPELDPAGSAVSVLGMSRDVTAHRRAEREAVENAQRLRGIIEATAEPIVVVDLEGTILFGNPAAGDLLGRSPGGLRGLPLGLPLVSGEATEVELLRVGGEVRAAEMRFAQARLGEQDALVVTLHDLTERKRYEAQIAHLASHDALTGLPNRALLRDRVEQAISHARRAGENVGLLFVDLDRFKLVNDSWGHTFGDALLMECSRRLVHAVRDGDTVARLGGDEFVILLPQLARAEDGARVAEKAAAALSAPFEIDGKEILTSGSIGISVFPEDGEDLDTLLRCADAAMYRAKEVGRNGYQFHRREMSMAARERVDTESALRQALARGELRLHYQPQVALADGRVMGFEALIRWDRPGAGLVGPGKFIPIAEDTGLIVPMGQWALHEACRQVAAWRLAGFQGLKVAVNLSARQFARGSVTDAVAAALAESHLPPAQLEVEITESAVVQDLDKAMRSLRKLREMGVSVAIDDFGTGYSSLAYLRMLPINKIKIDKSFLAGAPGDPQAAALTGEIVRLAHVLGLEVVAEGVERMEQALFLRDAGCEGLQGFLFAPALTSGECRVLLESDRRLEWPAA